MTVTLKRQLNDDEKNHILTIHGRKCFATGHEISDGEEVHFDHIQAFTLDGVSELDNIAPMRQDHNLQKGTLSLVDFRVKLQLNEFFKRGDRLTVGHLLRYLKERGDITEFGKAVTVSELDDSVQVESSAAKQSYRLYHCPLTKWRYFYATLDISLLDSDDELDHSIGLQPRYLIPDKVFELYRHFQRHPVLLPSIGALSAIASSYSMASTRLPAFSGPGVGSSSARLTPSTIFAFSIRRNISCARHICSDAILLIHNGYEAGCPLCGGLR